MPIRELVLEKPPPRTLNSETAIMVSLIHLPLLQKTSYRRRSKGEYRCMMVDSSLRKQNAMIFICLRDPGSSLTDYNKTHRRITLKSMTLLMIQKVNNKKWKNIIKITTSLFKQRYFSTLFSAKEYTNFLHS